MKNDTEGKREEDEAGGRGGKMKRAGEERGVDINWEINVKGSTSHCKRCTEREVTRRQKKAAHKGVGGFVCVCRVEGHGEKPIQSALKGHLAFWLFPCSFCMKDFPSSCAMPLMSSSEGA